MSAGARKMMAQYAVVHDALKEAGVPIARAGTVEDAERAMEAIAEVSGRSCGDCGECCTVFPIWEAGKPGMSACEHSCRGCAIYESRPSECRMFTCFWLLGMFRERDRPDRSHLVFDWISETSSVAHEALGPTCRAEALIRCTTVDMAYALRNPGRQLVEDASHLAPVLVHAGTKPEVRLYVRGESFPIEVVEHGEGAFTYASARILPQVRYGPTPPPPGRLLANESCS